MENKYEILGWKFKLRRAAQGNDASGTLYIYSVTNANELNCNELRVHSYAELTAFALSHDPYQKWNVVPE